MEWNGHYPLKLNDVPKRENSRGKKPGEISTVSLYQPHTTFYFETPMAMATAKSTQLRRS